MCASFHICPKSAYCSLVRRGLEACLHSLPSVFDLLCELLFDFPLLLRADIYLLLSFTLLSAHFLIALISCHGLGSFSLPIPHGMHLVATTQLASFG